MKFKYDGAEVKHNFYFHEKRKEFLEDFWSILNNWFTQPVRVILVTGNYGYIL